MRSVRQISWKVDGREKKDLALTIKWIGRLLEANNVTQKLIFNKTLCIIFNRTHKQVFYVFFFFKNEYLIRWKGYTSLEDTWEVEENLNETAIR